MLLSNNFIYAFTTEYYQLAKQVKCKSKAKKHKGHLFGKRFRKLFPWSVKPT